MNYRKICGLMFALLISISVFAIDFSEIKAQFTDSTGLDTTEYVAELVRMENTVNRNYQHYLDVMPVDSLRGVRGIAECEQNRKEIAVEMLVLSGADSVEIAEMTDENNISALWAIPAAVILGGVEAIRRWRAKRKAAKVEK
uniref:Uncharacterized protein n=1 Tax=viral metagenome TaxID=1070528 RepID=A0A6H1ZHR7_9ZZZZ